MAPGDGGFEQLLRAAQRAVKRLREALCRCARASRGHAVGIERPSRRISSCPLITSLKMRFAATDSPLPALPWGDRWRSVAEYAAAHAAGRGARAACRAIGHYAAWRSLTLLRVRRSLTFMRTRVSSKGQIVLPAVFRRMDRVETGQAFEVERLDRGDYRLVRRVAQQNEGAIDWLLACPRKDFFVSIDSESTDAL